MSDVITNTHERLGARLADLPPAPSGWVAAAKAMPAARAALEDIQQRVLDGHEQRAALSADLAAAVERAGHESSPELLQALRRLGS